VIVMDAPYWSNWEWAKLEYATQEEVLMATTYLRLLVAMAEAAIQAS
jgi:hypothetical protein